MFTLSRKAGDYVVLIVEGKTVTIRLDKVKGGFAELSIGAPSEVKIIRGESLEEELLKIG